MNKDFAWGDEIDGFAFDGSEYRSVNNTDDVYQDVAISQVWDGGTTVYYIEHVVDAAAYATFADAVFDAQDILSYYANEYTNELVDKLTERAREDIDEFDEVRAAIAPDTTDPGIGGGSAPLAEYGITIEAAAYSMAKVTISRETPLHEVWRGWVGVFVSTEEAVTFANEVIATHNATPETVTKLNRDNRLWLAYHSESPDILRILAQDVDGNIAVMARWNKFTPHDIIAKLALEWIGERKPGQTTKSYSSSWARAIELLTGGY